VQRRLPPERAGASLCVPEPPPHRLAFHFAHPHLVCIEPTKQMMRNRTEQIKAILTPDQLQKYLSQRGR
jgi:hypothetical protein